MTRAIIFDYGNVLCFPQEPSDMEAMATVLDLDPDQFHDIYWRYRLPYDRSDMDSKSYWTQVAADANRTLSAPQIETLIALDNQGWTHPDSVMIRWASTLRASGLRTAILSNMPLPLRQYLDRCPWLPQFDHSTYSCDVRLTKPDPRIYHHCLDGLGVEPNEAIFLDDREENIDAARCLGIHAFLFTTHEQALADLPCLTTKTDPARPG